MVIPTVIRLFRHRCTVGTVTADISFGPVLEDSSKGSVISDNPDGAHGK